LAAKLAAAAMTAWTIASARKARFMICIIRRVERSSDLAW
jgi:hypothetical protein